MGVGRLKERQELFLKTWKPTCLNLIILEENSHSIAAFVKDPTSVPWWGTGLASRNLIPSSGNHMHRRQSHRYMHTSIKIN